MKEEHMREIDGSGATYRRELSPLYRTPGEANRAKERILSRNPYIDTRIAYLPLQKKWVVVE
jgi:hypothetical protein